MDINERVMRLIESVAPSKTAFSKATGISAVVLSHIGSGRNKVSLNAVVQILKTYPQINAEYLLLGKGGMFKEADSEQLQKIQHAVQQAIELNQLNKKRLGQQLKMLEDLCNSDDPRP